MTKVLTADLVDYALDWAVAKCAGSLAPLGNLHLVGKQLFIGINGDLGEPGQWVRFSPSTDLAQGHAILDDEGIDRYCSLLAQPTHPDPAWRVASWSARYQRMGFGSPMAYGPTSLIAGLRCYVTRMMGTEVDIPAELLN